MDVLLLGMEQTHYVLETNNKREVSQTSFSLSTKYNSLLKKDWKHNNETKYSYIGKENPYYTYHSII